MTNPPLIFHWLKKHAVYEWITPFTARGLRFEVMNIIERLDLIGTRRVYQFKYLNYPFFPRPTIVEIGATFISNHIQDLVLIKEPVTINREVITPSDSAPYPSGS